MKLPYTLKDIAEMAGVSRATVDRVIHGRGTVSKKTYEKIKLILDKINYQPNLVAQSLRKGTLCKIAVLMPDSDYDIFWKRAIDGIDIAMEELSILGINMQKHLFNPFKETSFQIHAKQVFKGDYDGVLVAPIFYNESMEFFNQCKEKELPYVTFNTFIGEDDKLCHVGQDLIQSGEIAGSLLHKIVSEKAAYLTIHIDEDIANARHMQEKEIGFKQFLSNAGVNDRNIHTLKIDEPGQIEKKLIKLIDENSNIEGLFVTTSKVHYIADVVEAYKLPVKIIGYDLIEDNLQHLESGNITFLIFQNPGVQASDALNILVDHLAFKKEVSNIKLLPIEIVVKENYRNYI